MPLTMQIRSQPSLPPRRLGTRRRRERSERTEGGAGARCAQRAGGEAARSLDKYSYLATSVHSSIREWAKSQETKQDRYKRKLYLQGILLNSLRSLAVQGVNPRRQRDWERISNCQKEWIGFRSDCCDRATVAVPIGCNHRLCVLCNTHRCEHYRERVRVLFDRLKNPVFLTLTVPNFTKISKRSYARMRRATRKLIAQNKAWMEGGIYALETTFNRRERTWHIHVHCLISARCALPRDHQDFLRLKRTLEFEWLRLTGGRAWAKGDFDYWNARLAQLPDCDWNRENRRVIDIRPVRDRDRAAFEVLKYITKVSDFSDQPLALEEFLCAVKSVRLLQTFGSWYGFDFEANVNKTWAKLACSCGENRWTKIGKFFRECVEMLPNGRWALKQNYTRWLPRPPELEKT